MSSRRGLLVQPNRRRQTGDASAAGSSAAAAARQRSQSPQALAPLAFDDLPPHQPLELPLSDASVRKIAEIMNRSATTRTYDTHLKKSAELLRETVGSVNDVFSERTTQLQETADRRRERGRDQPSRAEEELAKTVARLTDRVGGLTQQVEQRARATIDMQMELEDEREALTWTSAQLVLRQEEERLRRRLEEAANRGGEGSQRQARKRKRAEVAEAAGGQNIKGEGRGEGRGEDEEEEDEEEENGDADQDPPPTSVVDLLREARETRAGEYAQMTSHQKYGLNNDYITFKQTWHDAVFPDGDVALPDAAAWFDAAGEPAKYGPNAGDAGAGADDDNANNGGNNHDDDDIIVAREVISFKCPLTLVTMTDPYKSRVCNHTFEKAGIMEYLRQGPQRCPQTGCDRNLTKQDLVPDNVMRRRIQRAEQMEQRRNETAATSDIDADDVEGVEDVEDVEEAASGSPTAGKREASRAESVARSVKRERFQRMR